VYYITPHQRNVYGTVLSAALAAAGILSHAEPACAQARTHVISDGETLSELADRYDVTVEELRSWNDLHGDLIAAGRELIVCDAAAAASGASGEAPAETVPAEGAPQTYVVARSDTMGCIADRFGVGVDALSEANPQLDGRRIRAGQRLVIPGRARDALALADERRVVAPGETLDAIAGELGVSVAELQGWNPDLDPARLQPGRELVFRRAGPVEHVVAPHETLSEIAERSGVAVADVVAWNAGIEPDRIAVGQRLLLRPHRPPTESFGAPTCGRLVDGRQLPPHPAYVIRNPDRSWATDETIEQLRTAFDAVILRHPTANRVRVHDLSLPGGGPIDDHRSHQSGRDVDIIYYQRTCADGVCGLEHVLPRQLDFGPQWTLLEHWLRRREAQRIFIDYGLQEVLYNYARRHGATRTELEAWFQYPRGRNADVGVIRHFPNHGDHLHVRFVCPEDDASCR
jgi:LysM repeat protein